jgi:CspA family cold shock protein
LLPRAFARHRRKFPQNRSSSLRGIVPCRRISFLEGTIVKTGTVKWFDGTRGFGFIQPDQGGTDVFVHISAVERSGLGNLSEGQKISYEVVRDQRSGKDAADNLQAAD